MSLSPSLRLTLVNFFPPSHTATVTVIAATMAAVAVADTAVAGVIIVMVLAAASVISTGVYKNRFPLRKISTSKTSASVLVLTAI